MANDTCLQMVNAKEITALKADPVSIGDLEKPANQIYSTYFPCSINYFIVGDPYPAPDSAKPLTAALFGLELIECESFEAGNIGIVPPGKVATIASRLEKIDLEKVVEAVANADATKLARREVDDFGLLIHDEDPDATEEDPGKTLVDEIRRLAKYYRRAATKKLGIAMFTA
jgi:hypothetical protein